MHCAKKIKIFAHTTKAGTTSICQAMASQLGRGSLAKSTCLTVHANNLFHPLPLLVSLGHKTPLQNNK